MELKNIMNKKLFGVVMTILSTACLAWPTEKVTVIVPYPPGGLNDRIARSIQPDLEKNLGVSVVIQNMPGVSNVIAMNHVFRLNDASHTFILTQDDFISGPLFNNNLSYRRFKPATIIGYSTYLLVSNNQATVEKFANEIKTGAIVNIGHNGVNGSAYLWLKGLRSRLVINDIPYKGGGPTYFTDIAGGATQYGVIALANAGPQIQSGRLVPVAIASDLRNQLYPNIPTFKELGFQNPEPYDVWNGVFARNDVSDSKVAMLATAIRDAVRRNTRMQDLVKDGYVITDYDVAASQAYFNRQVKKFEAIKQAQVK